MFTQSSRTSTRIVIYSILNCCNFSFHVPSGISIIISVIARAVNARDGPREPSPTGMPTTSSPLSPDEKCHFLATGKHNKYLFSLRVTSHVFRIPNGDLTTLEGPQGLAREGTFGGDVIWPPALCDQVIRDESPPPPSPGSVFRPAGDYSQEDKTSVPLWGSTFNASAASPQWEIFCPFLADLLRRR